MEPLRDDLINRFDGSTLLVTLLHNNCTFISSAAHMPTPASLALESQDPGNVHYYPIRGPHHSHDGYESVYP